MPHSVWKGHISFGLVNIPVALFSASNPKELHFSLLDSKNHGKIRYERINEETGKEVPWEKIVKGYEYEDGQYVVLTKEDFDSVASENLKAIEIEDFVPIETIDFIYFDTPYYLLPDKKGDKGYVLLRETLKKTKKIGIARVMIRSRQYIAAIVPYGNALILNMIRYSHELKKPKDFDLPDKELSKYKISPKEIEVAEQLVESMSVDFKPDHYKDEYYEKLNKLIEQKIKHGDKASAKLKTKEGVAKSTNVIDFMELLKASVKKKKKKSTAKRTKTDPKDGKGPKGKSPKNPRKK